MSTMPSGQRDGDRAAHPASPALHQGFSDYALRLTQENELLRERCAHLAAAANTWIRLYESALQRANRLELQHPAVPGADLSMV